MGWEEFWGSRLGEAVRWLQAGTEGAQRVMAEIEGARELQVAMSSKAPG